MVERGDVEVPLEVIISVSVIRPSRQWCPAAGDAALGLRGKVTMVDVYQSMGWGHGRG